MFLIFYEIFYDYKDFLLKFSIFSLVLGTHIRVQYFQITEDTANVINITEICKNGFEENDLVLIQANGL